MFRSLIAIAVVVLGVRCARAGDFAKSLAELRQNRTQLGRDLQVEKFKKLIESEPSDPLVPEACLEVAHILESSDPARGVKTRPAEALKWFRRAATKAKLSSHFWRTANIEYASHLWWENPVQARAIYEDLTRNCQGHLLTQAQVEHDLQMLSVIEKKYAEAERHCLKLSNWCDEQKRIPTDANEKASLEGLVRSSACGMIVVWAESYPGSKKERAQKIRACASKNGATRSVRELADRMLKELAQSTATGSNT